MEQKEITFPINACKIFEKVGKHLFEFGVLLFLLVDHLVNTLARFKGVLPFAHFQSGLQLVVPAMEDFGKAFLFIQPDWKRYFIEAINRFALLDDLSVMGVKSV